MHDVHVRQRIDALVAELKAQGAITSTAVERAFRAVPRHRFLERFSTWDEGSSAPVAVPYDPRAPAIEQLDLVYSDRAFGTWFEAGMPVSSTSQPSLMAQMLEALDVAPGMRVLEIGTGTGYNAALLAEILGEDGYLITVDIEPEVAEQARRLLDAAGYGRVHVAIADGTKGRPRDAPFDRVEATVGCPDLSPAWVQQLRDGGLLVVPLEHGGLHPIVQLRKRGLDLDGSIVCWSGFIPIRGGLAQELPWGRGAPTPSEDGEGAERPAWRGYGSGKPIKGWGAPRDEMDLFFYLCINDRRAFHGSRGPGLWDPGRGWASAGGGTIAWAGDRNVLDDLERRYEEWNGLGKPPIGRYRLRFVPVGVSEPSESHDICAIERRSYREEVFLEPEPGAGF